MTERKKKQKHYMGRRVVKCLAVALFAALLAVLAVYRPDAAWGGTTSSTGKKGSIPIAYSSNYKSNSTKEIGSDCQGFYFYITPVDPQQPNLNYFPGSVELISVYPSNRAKRAYRTKTPQIFEKLNFF